MTSLVSLILQPSITQWSQRTGALEDLLGIYGSAMDQTRAKQWLRAFAEADFSGLPPVITLSAERMPGLWGGYSREKNRIYISSDCPPEHLAAVLLEEMGHFLDRELCVCETTGEEGARFAAVVLGQQPSAEQLATWAKDEGFSWVLDQGGPVLVEGAKKKSGGGGKKNSGGSNSDGGGKKKKSESSKSGGSSEKRKKSRSSPPADSGGGGSSSGGAAPVASQPPKPSDFQDDPVQSYPGETLTGSSGSTFVVSDPANVTIGGNLTGTETIETDADGLNLGNFNQIENVILTGVANISANGNSLGNVITGNAGNNNLSGGEGNDTLVGLAGNDSLDGGTGNDSMVGGTGDDTFVVDDNGDVILEAENEGTDVVSASVDYVLSNHLEALELSGTADIDGTGNSLGNTITGNSGHNFLDGLGGNDTISGAGGNDTMLGGAGNDSLDGGTGNDSLIGGAGDDTFVVESDTDSIVENANEGTDVVQSSLSYSLGNNLENLVLTGSAVSGTGNSLSNALTGNSVGNSLDGGTGIDIMTGAQGNDTYFVDHTSDVVTENSGEGTDLVVASVGYALANHVEHLVLTETAISGTGNSLNNSITGNSVGNSLNGGSGVDTLVGGVGNDTYIVDTATDRIVEDGGDAADWVVSSVSFNLSNALVGGGNAVENLQLTGTAVSGTGNALNNTLSGNSAGNTLDGELGNDSLDGGDGADSLIGGGGVDTFSGGAGNDTIVVDPANAAIVNGGADNDTIQYISSSGMTLGDSDFGGYTNIESYDFSGVTGNVDITIGLNAQNLGIAKLAGGTANSTLTANTSYSGSVHFTGGELEDSLTGNSGNDTLLDFGVGDTLVGDTLVGNAGNDSIDGGSGDDSMVGGLGNDTYVVDSALDLVVENPSEGTDVVRSSVSYTLGSNVEALVLTGNSAIHGTGNELNNTLTGNSLGNSLNGGVGNDSMIGGQGNDTYFLDTATDVITELSGEGTDLVVASVTGYTLAENVENLLLDTGVVSGIGNSLGNSLTGNILNNSLNGGAGLDAMIGSLGDDTYFVDNASEVVVEASGEGTDLVISSVSGYTLASHVENLELASSAIAGTGNSLNNMITGNSVGNSLDGGSGVDTLIGGSGNDTYFIDTTAEMIVETGSDSADVVVASVFFDLSSTLAGGGNSIENLQLTGTAVSGTGNALNNTLTGNSVGNSLNGGAGIDTMIGGQGNDTYFVDNATEVVTELSGEGTDLVVASVTGYTLAANVEQLQLAGAVVGGTGNSLANTLTGNATGNSLDGGAGIDSLIGGAGNDTYVVDNASDVVFENADEGEDLVQSSVSYTLAGNIEKLTLTGTAIAATGNSLTNTLTGNASANSLDGGSGIDSMVGGSGNDTYFVDNVGDVVFENASEGTDVVVTTVDGYTMASEIENLVIGGTANLAGSGSAGNNLLTGNSGNNLLTGNGGNDTFIGGEGNDTLVGGASADSMVGGVGSDSMDGGGGADTFIGGAGNDTIVVRPDPAVSVMVDGGADNDTLKFDSSTGMTLGDSNFGRYTNIESYDFSGVTGNVDITIGLNAQNLGIATLAGGTANSTLTANEDYTGSVYFTGGGGLDSLTGNSSNDTLLGAGGNDTLVGQAGNDSLDGGAEIDSMVGGAGNDTYVVDSESDIVVENSGEGTADVVRASINYTLSGNIESLELTGSGNIDGRGDSQANTISGNSGDNVLEGAGGKDTMLGGAGNDSIDGGTGDDSMVGGAGNDTYVVDSALDIVVENLGEGTDVVESSVKYTLGSNVEMLVLSGSDSITGTGNELNNTITGNNAKNTLNGGDGADSISGGQGDDSLYGGSGNDTLCGDEGNDTIKASQGNDSLVGGEGNDIFEFSSVDHFISSTVVGGADSDTLKWEEQVSLSDEDFKNTRGVEVLISSDLSNNEIELGLYSQLAGITSLFGGENSDFLSAAGMTDGNIWIQGSKESSTLGDTLVSGTDTCRATLVANDDAGLGKVNYFLIAGPASLLGYNSIVGGSTSKDVIYFSKDFYDITDNLILDAGFKNVRNIDTLSYDNYNSNTLSLGENAEAAFRGDTLFVEAIISGIEGSSIKDVIDLSNVKNKKVFLDVRSENAGAIITAGSNANTLIGGDDSEAADLFIFGSDNALLGSSVVGGGGRDTLRIAANAQRIGADTLAGVSGVDVLDIAGAGNKVTLEGDLGITTIVGGTGPNTIDASAYDSDPNSLTWNMGASNGSDSLLGGIFGNIFQIKNGANLQNSFITGNNGEDTIQLLAGAQTLGDSAFSLLSSTESFDDTNNNGIWDAGEAFTDLLRKNGTWDAAEILISDQNSNGIWETGDTFTDSNLNGTWDAAEILISDQNSNDIWDTGDTFTDTMRNNGVWDNDLGLEKLQLGSATNGNSLTLGTIAGGEAFTDSNASGNIEAAEILTLDLNSNGSYDAGDTFTDTNRKNGTWDAAEILTLDLNSNGSYDVGDTFTDSNANGTWDAAEILTLDVNSNGVWDLGDTFTDTLRNNGLWDATEFTDSNANGTWDAGKGISTVIGGTRHDTIDATAFGSAITIDASASSGARLLGSTVNSDQNTLIGGSAGGNEFIVGALGANSVVGGSNGLDTLTFSSATTINDATANGQIHDGSTASISKVGTLKFGDNGNNIVLGSDALVAGIRTLVGGEGDDDGTGNIFNTSAYGSAGVLFQITDQGYLANITTLVGGTGVDTLKFSRDGISLTDEVVSKLHNIDVLKMANGNNRILFDDDYLTKGIDSIIGGTGRDTIDMSSNVVYTPTSDADIITVDLRAGAGYSLISSTQNFAYAQVIGSSQAGSVFLAGNNLDDDDFRHMYQANIGQLEFLDNGAAVTLAGNALASGMKSLQTSAGSNTVDVTEFFGQLRVNGGFDHDRVVTSFAALSDLTFVGGNGIDTLQLVGSDARAITSLKGQFSELQLNDGNNFVALGNDADLSAIYGGGGFDTISMLQNTNGINFVMQVDALGNDITDASLVGGSGDDTITLANAPTALFDDTRFTRLGAAQLQMYTGRIENFSTHIDGGKSYELGAMAEACGINRVFFFDGDEIDASAFNPSGVFEDIRGLEFVFQEDSDLGGSTIIGTNVPDKDDTLTLRSDQDLRPWDTFPDDQLIDDIDFQDISSIEVFVFESSFEIADDPNDLTIDLGVNAENSGIKSVISGEGDDLMDASGYLVAGIGMTGGSGNDSLFGGAGDDTLTGSSSAAFGAEEIDTLTGGLGADIFILGDALNAFYNTVGRAGDMAVILDFDSAEGDAIQLRDLSATYGLAADPANPGSAFNNYGYVIGADIYITGAAANSFLYIDIDKSGSISTGDNLVAAIQNTGGALANSDLLTSKFTIV